MRLIETTHFWNEDHFFRERVQNSLSYADILVIAEAEESHSEKIKRPFKVPGLLKTLPDALQERVIFLPVDLSALRGQSFEARDAYERDAGFNHLKKNGLIQKDDLVLVQDFDEFFHPEAKAEVYRYFANWLAPWRRYLHPKYRCTYYFLNSWISAPVADRDWSLPVFFKASYGWSAAFSPHTLRNRRSRKISRNHWGWHHSYLGNAQQIQEKLKSFSHANDDMVLELDEKVLLQRRAELKDLFGRPMEFEVFEDYATIGIPVLKDRQDLFVKRSPTAAR